MASVFVHESTARWFCLEKCIDNHSLCVKMANLFWQRNDRWTSLHAPIRYCFCSMAQVMSGKPFWLFWTQSIDSIFCRNINYLLLLLFLFAIFIVFLISFFCSRVNFGFPLFFFFPGFPVKRFILAGWYRSAPFITFLIWMGLCLVPFASCGCIADGTDDGDDTELISLSELPSLSKASSEMKSDLIWPRDATSNDSGLKLIAFFGRKARCSGAVLDLVK